MAEPARLTADRVTDVITHHGEGPVWDPARHRLHLVDMLAGAVVTLDPTTGEHARLDVGSRVAAALRPRSGGGMVVAVERGFTLVDPDGTLHPQPELWSDAQVRMNDGGTDPDGRFYCGTMAYDAASGAGSFWRLDTDLTTHELFGDVTISNGFAFSPDGSVAYYIDTPTGRVDVFDYSDGALVNRRTAVPDAGHPDGMTVDAEGNLWVADFGGALVRHFTPTGQLLTEVSVGARQVTACTFGGDDLATLYITTSRQDLADGEDPAAGSVFAIAPGVTGLPPLTFDA